MDIDVKLRRLTDAAAALNAAARAIDEELQTLARASHVLTTAWEGEAAQSYSMLSSRFHTASRAQVHVLRKAAVSLDTLAREYGSTDVRGAHAVPRVDSR